NLHMPVVSTNQNSQQLQASENEIIEPKEVAPVDTQQNGLTQTNALIAPEEKQIPDIVEVPKPLPVAPLAKTAAPLPTSINPVKSPAPVVLAEQNKKQKAPVQTNTNPVMSSTLPVVAEQKKKQKAPEKPELLVTAVVATKPVVAEKPNGKRARKTKTTSTVSTPPASSVEAAMPGASITALNKYEVQKETANDASVKQFLQRFSRVYSEGDYFALHNLFTKDLTILGAPPQRSVLRSYRKLFEGSESREISLDHVTWLASDEHIVVIASYQAQVMPRGKAETQSSRGDIRLDLRMENGQLKIIRLQSDTKNG
ncbi:MAG: hypothetical protein ACREPB_09690, partial [Arenimonas sp.]